MPNFCSLALLEVPEKFVWGGGGWGGGLHSHFHVKPNRWVEVRVRFGVLTTIKSLSTDKLNVWNV